MRRMILLCVLAVLTLPGRSLAAPDGTGAALGSNVAVKSAVLSITGTSTMHDYAVTTKTLKVIAGTASGEDLLQPAALQAFAFEIPVSSFVSDKDGLTKQMAKALKADKHPVITFRLTGYAVEGSVVKPTGTITVAGVEKPVDLVLDVKDANGVLTIRGTRDLLMTDFGIKPPTMFMGMLKTNDKVTIKFELQLAHAAKASN